MKTYIKYYDKISGTIFNILSFDDKTTEDDIYIKYKHDMYKKIYESLSILSKEPAWDSVPCFSLDDQIMRIKKDDVMEHLNNCLDYFTQIEEYEKCSDLIKIKKLLSHE